MSNIVQIDGNLGEGGGQVLRVALSLSVLYKIPVEINNIRADRSKPGLAAQHLEGVELLTRMCNAEVQGAHLRSTYLKFRPGCLNADKKQTFVADTRTAGCIPLLAQVALPCAIFFPQNDVVTLILKGGTNVPMGPHIEYLTEVMKVLLNKFGADFDFKVVKRGYYPKGGGEIHLYIKPVRTLHAIALTDCGLPLEILGWAYTAGDVNNNEAWKMAKDAKEVLKQRLENNNISVPPIKIESYKESRDMTITNGSGINLVCNSSTGCVFGGSGLGSVRGKQTPPGEEAANQIADAIITGSCVDEHAQDQLIIFMALAEGTSRINIGNTKLTSHAETAIQIAEIMLGDRGLSFKLLESETEAGIVTRILECKGCGYRSETTQ